MSGRVHGEAREYLSVGGTAVQTEPGALGRESWELAGVGGPSEVPTFSFKRRGLEFRDRVTLEQVRRHYALLGHPLAEGIDGGRHASRGEEGERS